MDDVLSRLKVHETVPNFIKPLPDGENAAVDQSLLWLQVRVRKGSEWEKALKEWLEEMLE